MGRRRKAWLWGGDGRRFVGGALQAGFYVRWSEYPGGTRVNRSQHFDTLAAAKRWVRQHNARRDLGLLGEIVPIAVSTALSEWIESSRLGPATESQYQGVIQRFMAEFRDGVQVCELVRAHVETYIGLYRGKNKATLAKNLRVLRAFLNWCVRRSYLATSPMADFSRLASSHHARERPQLSEADLARLVRAAEGDRRIAVLLAMTSGLDRGVIRRLKPQNVSVDEGVIRVERPKTGKPLVVPIHSALLPALRERMRRCEPHARLFDGLDYYNSKTDWWNPIRIAAGLPGVMFRDLRAVASSRLLRAGVPLTDVRDLLGHSTVAVTAAHYSTPAPSVRESLSRLSLPGYRPRPSRARGKRDSAARHKSKTRRSARRGTRGE